VEEPDGVALELLPLRLVAVHIRQARDTMSPADTGAALTVSGAGSRIVGHRGNRPAAGVCAGGMPRSSPPRLRSCVATSCK
jgi:hypothetical protein